MAHCVVCDNRYDCEILKKLREITDMYKIEMSVTIEKCALYK